MAVAEQDAQALSRCVLFGPMQRDNEKFSRRQIFECMRRASDGIEEGFRTMERCSTMAVPKTPDKLKQHVPKREHSAVPCPRRRELYQC
jgi:hypothetical protein